VNERRWQVEKYNENMGGGGWWGNFLPPGEGRSKRIGKKNWTIPVGNIAKKRVRVTAGGETGRSRRKVRSVTT
jgi:hypothetical protein